jgi:hypothetical protein
MAKPTLGAIAALAALALASLAIKSTQFEPLAEPAIDHLVAPLTAALATNGYRVSQGTGAAWNKGIVVATKADCTIRLTDATRFGPDMAAVSQLRLNNGRPVRYMHRGGYIRTYPRIRIEIEWRIQRELARLGWKYPIDPIVAVGAAAHCWPDPAVIAGVEFRPY